MRPIRARLRRTVPFLRVRESQAGAEFVLDEVYLPASHPPNKRLTDRVASSLNLTCLGPVVPVSIAEQLVSDQYATCISSIEDHCFWSELETGTNRVSIFAYLLETRHYLHAAPWRMAPAVARGRDNGPLVRLQAKHLLEEADHARFFERALALLGIPIAVTRRLRPAPVTIEWIHLMRALAARGPLVSSLCSGLLESTALDRSQVRRWHDMLIERQLLPADVVKAIQQHVDIDESLGHGDTWRIALNCADTIPTPVLVEGLNGITAVAEMIVRWLDSLRSGMIGHLVPLLARGRPTVSRGSRLDSVFSGSPVWHAEILHQLTYGGSEGGAASALLAAAFHGFSSGTTARGRFVASRANATRRRLAVAVSHLVYPSTLSVRPWLRTIDGHRLWTEMLQERSTWLIWGWVAENFHYIDSASRHVAAAIAACTDPKIRAELLIHLAEEIDHARLLRKPLDEYNPRIEIEACRPLPTTQAFIGYLTDLASTDWHAYILAIAFLQLTLTQNSKRHTTFYRLAGRHTGQAALHLLAAMRRHDRIDGELDHGASIVRILRLLHARHKVVHASIERAALVAQLAWSFLDGIRAQYRNGPATVAQRIGWVANSDS